jgi:hypothetical protein
MSNSAFDPAGWLERFEAAGGGWIVQDGRPALLIPAGTLANVLVELDAPGCREAVRDLIHARHAAKEMTAAE